MGCVVQVGDPHQQIYSFMGAVDAMQRVREQLEGQPGNLLVLRSLRRSFRFGPQIASVGNAILRVKQERRTVLGMRALAHRHVSHVVHAAGALHCQLRRRDSDDKHDEGPLAVLCRSNWGLLKVALQCTDLRPGVKLAFVGGVETLKLELVQDTFHLLAGHAGEVKNAYLRAFASPRGGGFKALVKVAEMTGDVELGEAASTLVLPRSAGFSRRRV